MLVGSLVMIVVTLCKIGSVRKPEEGRVGQSEPVTGSNNQSEGFFFFPSFFNFLIFFIKEEIMFEPRCHITIDLDR